MILEIGKIHCKTPLDIIEIHGIKENHQEAGVALIKDKANNNVKIRPILLLKMKIK